MFPAQRPRRLRRTPAIRRLVAETTLTPGDFVAPLFVAEGLRTRTPIASLPGHFQHTISSLHDEVKSLLDVGVSGGHSLRRAREQRRVRQRRLGPRGHRPGGPSLAARRVRRRAGSDGRSVPGRVHDARPLRGACAATAPWTTTRPWSSTRGSRWPRPRPGRTSSPRAA